MRLEIEKGTEADLDGVEQLYGHVIDRLEAGVNYPGWRKGLYPARDTAAAGIEEGALYVARDGDRLVGTVILRHAPEEGYEGVDWHVELDYEDIFVIYTFAVHPDYMGQGVGKLMLDFIAELGRKERVKAIRLDVCEQNVPAIRLYKKCGFDYIGTVDLGYGEFGLDYFELYQKLL